MLPLLIFLLFVDVFMCFFLSHRSSECEEKEDGVMSRGLDNRLIDMVVAVGMNQNTSLVPAKSQVCHAQFHTLMTVINFPFGGVENGDTMWTEIRIIEIMIYPVVFKSLLSIIVLLFPMVGIL